MKHLKIKNILIVSILVIALILVFLLQSNTLTYVNNISKKTALKLLSDNANQVKRVLDNQINNLWCRIEMVDYGLSTFEKASVDQTLTYLDQSIPDAQNIKLVFDNDTYVSISGEKGKVDVSKEIKSLFYNEEKICILNQTDEMDTLLFAMPVTSSPIEGNHAKYIFVEFNLNSLIKLLSVESYSGKGIIRIINSKGLILFHTNNIERDIDSSSFFQMYESSSFCKNSDIQDLDSFKKSVLAGENKALHIITNSAEEIVSYSKMNALDWYVTISVDYDMVFSQLKKGINSVGMSSIYSSLGIVLLAFAIILAISMDILKIRKEKKHLEDMNNSLEKTKQVAEEALEVAENANKSKSVFLSSMSHDIRTPMNAIVGFTSLMNYYSNDVEKVKEYTKRIYDSSQYLLSLINNILDLSKIESGTTILNPTNESIYEIIDEVSPVINHQAGEKRQSFTIKYHDIKHERIIVDKLRFNQIIMNLLSNAVKYTPQNGHINLDIYETSSSDFIANYKIVVKDDGYGMSEDYIEKIFKSFSREDDLKISKIQGTGLGMSITKKIIDLMGGVIGVKSIKGKGSTFTIEIPLQYTLDEINTIQKDSPSDISLLENSQESVLNGKNILVAEDNELNADILRELLTISGAKCKICENGKKLIEAFNASKPGEYDLILMDVQMPIVNGYEATRIIRKSNHPLAKSILIIAMTANAFTEDVKEAKMAGMNAHISKPLKLCALEETIKKSIVKTNFSK